MSLLSLIEPVTSLVSEFITDKDKVNELAGKMNELYEKGLKSAREHDKASYGDKLVDRFRGLIRPTCTAIVIVWYVYARINDIILDEKDYAIIGGVLAFWFGFRPFDKKK